MKRTQLALVAALGLACGVSHAGVYADDMSKCLVESTTKENRLALVRWMFSAMAQHPAVSTLSTVSEAQVDKANSEVGALFMELLTVKCVDVTKKAIKYEGPVAIPLSFQVLGQVATSDLFSDPAVAKVMAGLDKYTDKARLEALSK